MRGKDTCCVQVAEAQEVAAKAEAVEVEVAREGEETREESAVSRFSTVHSCRGTRLWMRRGIVTGKRGG